MKLTTLSVAGALCAACLIIPAPPARATVNGSCQVAAHRGNTNVSSSTATENGMKAFRRATSLGVDWLETDVGASSDDQPMLMHDSTVDRTTNGTGTLRSKTAAQARLLRLDDGSQIPYLTELLVHAQQTNKRVLLELKSPGGTLWWTRVSQAVATYGGGRVVLQSISAATLDKAATVIPGVPRSLVYWHEIPVSTARTYGGIVIDKSVATDTYLAQLAGVAVYPYLVSSLTEWNRLAGRVDALITNNPASLLKWRTSTPGC